MKNKFKVFFTGFDYGVKNYNKDKDTIFYSYSDQDKENILYRKSIKAGKIYAFYRYEFLAAFILLVGIIILLFPY